jgi:hypothetical protein
MQHFLRRMFLQRVPIGRKTIDMLLCESKLSNGHSPANLSNSSTRQNGHLPDIRQPLSPDSIHSLTFAKGHF